MLIRFVKHTAIEWGADFHSWYAPGDCAVGTILKKDENGVRLLLYSDDDMECIVPPDSFIIEESEPWNGDLPTHCRVCREPHDQEDHFFFCAHGVTMCMRCFNESDYYLVKPLLTDPRTSRYELDKAEGRWIRTG